MAAGCPALLKPSEVGPVVSALFADFFPKYLDTSAYRVTNGGVPEITYILKLKWESQCVRRSEDLALHIMRRFAYSSFVCVLAHSTPVPSAASATAPTSPDFGSNSNIDDDDDTNNPIISGLPTAPTTPPTTPPTSSKLPAPSTLTLCTSRLCYSPM
jgi:hypothetical protein